MTDSSNPKDLSRAIIRLSSRGWVSLKGFARIVGVAYPTALSMVERGELRAIKIGKHRRVYVDEAMRFLNDGNYEKPNGSENGSPTENRSPTENALDPLIPSEQGE